MTTSSKKKRLAVLQAQFKRIDFWPAQQTMRDFAGLNGNDDLAFVVRKGDSLKTVRFDVFVKALRALPDKAGERRFWKQIDKAYTSSENQESEQETVAEFKKKYFL